MHISPAEPAGLLKRAHIGELGRVKTIVTSSKPLSVSDQALKRAFDLAVAVSALIPLAPVMLLIAAPVKATSSGPALYRQIRHGFNNEKILVWKFRSMHVSDEGEKFRQVDPGVFQRQRFQKISVARAARSFCLTAQPSAFSHAAISLAATLACGNSLPMVKKPWNWPGKWR